MIRDVGYMNSRAHVCACIQLREGMPSYRNLDQICCFCKKNDSEREKERERSVRRLLRVELSHAFCLSLAADNIQRRSHLHRGRCNEIPATSIAGRPINDIIIAADNGAPRFSAQRTFTR